MTLCRSLKNQHKIHLRIGLHNLNLSLIGAVTHILWQLQTCPFVNNFSKESKGYWKLYSFECMVDTTFTQQCKLQLIRTFWIFSDLLLLFFFFLACKNIHFSSLFAAGDVSLPPREVSPAAKSEEKRMFSQDIFFHL